MVRDKPYQPPKQEGWQYAPLHLVFDVKSDGRAKARCVMGGDVTNADQYDTFEATVKIENVRLLIIATAVNDSDVVMGDISFAFLNSWIKELLWS